MKASAAARVLLCALVVLCPSAAFSQLITTQLSDGVGNVEVFAVAPGSQRVLYAGDQESLGFDELYSRAVDGGPPVKLSLGNEVRVTPGWSILDPTGSWVLYRSTLCRP
ncbi:MAG: hypothetical protein AAF725_22325, partial [Acidobacteriota bacterium]